jgi:H+/Cl- antiporter ClcA
VLLFGGALFVFNLLFDIADHKQLWPSWAFSAVWWIVAGAFVGDWNWNSRERRFLRDRAHRAASSDR